MAKTVIKAFEIFLTDIVNLDSSQTKKARESREWLVEQIESFPFDDNKFPRIYSDKNIFFGSFSRNTKKRPLDDIDIMICLSADGCTYYEYSNRIEISVPETASRFIDYVHEGTNILNSRKIINSFISKLQDIHQYKNSEINRDHEAATLNLKSYDWVFDIVPCFFTTKDIYNKTFYIIPDGSGNWKKTDPRLDSKRLINLNTFHNKNLLNVIRTIKYWNKRPTIPSMGSYLLENMILDYYSERINKASEFVDLELVHVFYDIHKRVHKSVNDPKNIQGDLNNLSNDEKLKISSRAYSDYSKAFDARELEKKSNFKESINKWKEIFGDNFPKYEE